MATKYHEPELTNPVNLCDAQGRLNRESVGWSRQPLHTCNLRWTWPRPKRWNYWCVTGEDFLISIGVSDRGFTALGSAYFMEYKTKRFLGQSGERMLGRGVVMPEVVRADLRYDHPKIQVAFLEQTGNEITLQARSADFGGIPLDAHITVSCPPEHETLNVVIPWNDHLFQFTSKQECLPATGTVKIGNEVFEYAPGTAFATLDFGRGFWPRRSSWNWAAASGIQHGHIVGLNLGGKWTDGTGMNENGFVVDGLLTKIHEDLVWEYDDTDFLKPWRIYAPISKQVDVYFEPIYNRNAENDWVIYKRRVNQAFGYFSGYVVPDQSKEQIEINDLFGWAEELHALW